MKNDRSRHSLAIIDRDLPPPLQSSAMSQSLVLHNVIVDGTIVLWPIFVDFMSICHFSRFSRLFLA